MINNISDKELLEEIERRLSENNILVQKQQQYLKQLQLLNKKLDESESIKSQFLSNVRNEILNPFTSIITLSQRMLTSENLGYEKVIRIAGLIYKEAFNLDFQLKNIFEAAAIEAGESIPSTAEVNMKTLVKESVNYFLETSEQKSVSLVCKFKPGTEMMETFKTDPEKIKIIILNLISNAIKYSKEKSEVTVTSAISDNQFVLTVKDNGIGLDRSFEKEIFNRFNQLNSGSTKIFSGHGLGLSIVKHLVETLNGTIKIYSKKDKGTTFRITIPPMDTSQKLLGYLPEDNQFFFSPENKF